jgi:tetratricopeptide (TPR) repeat protein
MRGGDSAEARGERLLDLSSTAFWRGELGRAVRLAQQALNEGVATDNLRLQAQTLFALGGIQQWLAREDSAIALVDRGLVLAGVAEDLCLQAEGLLVRCAALFSKEELPDVEVDSLRAWVYRCDGAWHRARLALFEARCAVRAGEVERAKELLAWQPIEFLPSGLRAQLFQEKLFLKAFILGREHRHAEAVGAAEAVLLADREGDRRTAIVDDLWLLARLHSDAGDIEAAADAAERAISVLRAMFPRGATARKRELLSAWLDRVRETVAQ